MFSKLRQILLTQYIGPILIALLVWQAAIQVVTVAVQSGFWVYNNRNGSVLVRSGAKFPWESVVVMGITIGLYLLIGYVLARWLFPESLGAKTNAAKNEPGPPESELK